MWKKKSKILEKRKKNMLKRWTESNKFLDEEKRNKKKKTNKITMPEWKLKSKSLSECWIQLNSVDFLLYLAWFKSVECVYNNLFFFAAFNCDKRFTDIQKRSSTSAAIHNSIIINSSCFFLLFRFIILCLFVFICKMCAMVKKAYNDVKWNI